MEPDAHTLCRGEHDIVFAVGHLDVDELIALLDVDRADTDGARVAELRQHRLLHDAVLRGEQQELILGEFAHRHEGREALVGLHGHTGEDRLSPRRSRGLGNLVHFKPVALALLSEEHHVVVRRRDEQVFDPVVFFLMGRDHTFAAAALPTIGRYGQTLDVAGVRDRDHHVLFRDQVFYRELALIGHDLGAAVVAKPLRELGQLFLQDLHPPRLGGEDFLAFLDELADVLELLLELGDLQGGEPGQAHVEDFGRLLLRQLEALAQRGVGARCVLRFLDDLDHFVDVVDRDLQPFEDVLAVLRALQLELRAPRDHGVTVLDEVLQNLDEVHLLRHAIHEREHDRAEGLLHLRVLVELVQHDHGDGVALQLDDEPDSFLIRLVPDVADAFELLGEHEIADLFVHSLGAHLIRELRHDDLLLAARFLLFDNRAGANDDAAAALLVALLDPLAAVDDRTGREIGAFDDLADVLDARIWVIDEMHDRLDDFP